ncbi:MAG: tetratricopeptide repeat protein, partial [Gemmataceae bacterium]|nr:tetratricopeptide repeat protein [Gemmataceae bacterium]
MQPPALIDIGINLSHDSYDRDRAEVIARARAAGVFAMVVTGSTLADSERALALCRQWPAVLRATAGVHPHHAAAFQASDCARLAELYADPLVVAAGECGLDYYRNYSPPAEQRRAFALQLRLAVEHRLPLFLHQREAHADLMAMLREHPEQLSRAVLHCFTGDAAELEDCLGAGLSIGVTGWICDERRGQALRLQPDYARAHMARAMTWLAQGNWEQGWPEYEWRWRYEGFSPRPFPQPLWDGSPLAGRTILLHAEQGLGDTLHFIRYAALVKQQGGQVLVECPAVLHRLLASGTGIDELVAPGAPLPAFDVHAPLLSLPALFRTSLSTVPATVPYLFADAQLGAQWRDRLASVEGLKVGIAWQGNPRHFRDRQRSVLLTEFEPLARLEGVRLISLQRGPGVEQVPALGDRFPVLDLDRQRDETCGDFMDTAAVMTNLDLVITCDTAIAHLAGALGVPVWVALPFAPDWRWLRERADSPWYPTMRLFRQERWGDWASVFRRLADALQQGDWTSPTHPPGEPPPAPAQRVGEARFQPPAQAGVPDPAGRHLNHGVALGQQGRLDDAVVAFQEALLRRPGSVEAWFNLGIIRAQQGKPDEAVACYQQALRLDPGYAAAHINLGAVRMQQGQREEAVACFQEALRLKPEAVEAHLNLGKAFTEQGQHEQARTHLRQAVRLQPDVPETHYHVAAIHNQQGNLEEAVASCRQAIRLRPDYLAAHLELGNAFLDHGQLDEAVASLRQALPIHPDNADVHKNLALALLLRGDWEPGWQEYEWRGQELAWPTFPQPLWDGAPLAGRTILLHAEQGLGDTLHFIRYAALVKERGGRVIVAC